MSRHYERDIRETQEVMASTGQQRDDGEPRSREQIESFVRGFGIKGAAVKRMVDAWADDIARANSQGWEARADADYYNG